MSQSTGPYNSGSDGGTRAYNNGTVVLRFRTRRSKVTACVSIAAGDTSTETATISAHTTGTCGTATGTMTGTNAASNEDSNAASNEDSNVASNVALNVALIDVVSDMPLPDSVSVSAATYLNEGKSAGAFVKEIIWPALEQIAMSTSTQSESGLDTHIL